MTKLFFYLVLFKKYFTNKIFDFDTIPSENVLSSAVIANKPDTPLPKDFILCSSHFQKTIDTENDHGIYILYQEEELLNPWLSVGFWNDNILWANVAFNYWYEFGSVPDYFFEKWIHICLKIDVEGKSIEANVNGESLNTVFDVEGLTPTPKFNLRLGIVNMSYDSTVNQFHGQISNIHLIKNGKHKLSSLSTSACKMERISNNLLWDDMMWTRTNINETFLDGRRICQNSEYTLLRVPLKWTYEESINVCLKFGGGQIAGIENPIEPKNWTFQKQIYGVGCKKFWTSYLYDDFSSQKVRNRYTDKKIDILWNVGYPVKSQMKQQNAVLFNLKASKFQNVIPGNLEFGLLCNSSRE